MKMRQDAMTSEQVLLTALVLCCIAIAACLGGCASDRFNFGWVRKDVVEPLTSPYRERQLWAVVPLRNESGSLNPKGLTLADHLVR